MVRSTDNVGPCCLNRRKTTNLIPRDQGQWLVWMSSELVMSCPIQGPEPGICGGLEKIMQSACLRDNVTTYVRQLVCRITD